MGRITKEDLEQYRGLLKSIEAEEEELRTIYIESPPPKEVIGGRASVSTPGDPTARKAMKAIERREQLETLIAEKEAKAAAIRMFVDTIEDDYIVAAMMRFYYIMGKTWGETAKEMNGQRYGRYTADNCRMKVNRYFRKMDGEDI